MVFSKNKGNHQNGGHSWDFRVSIGIGINLYRPLPFRRLISTLSVDEQIDRPAIFLHPFIPTSPSLKAIPPKDRAKNFCKGLYSS